MSSVTTSKKTESAEKEVELLTPPTIEFDLNDSQYYLNREFSWLEFNRRVLAEAANPNNKLLERLKFLAIVNSNIDEFFMKRIGGLKQQLGARVQMLSIDGRTPQQQIEQAYELVKGLENRIHEIYGELRELLRENDVVI